MAGERPWVSKMGIGRILAILGVFLWLGSGVAMAKEKNILVVDRFTSGLDENGIPHGWALEKSLGSDSKIVLRKEKDNFFLHLLSVNNNFGLKKDISFDIRQHPYLSWRWKVTRLPRGGDIRKRETDDQAGQIYVLFPKFPAMVNTRSVGYMWDSRAPAGLEGTSVAYSKMKYVVLESGKSKLDQWVFESRNVYEDYKRLFQEEPSSVGAVLLFINTQHTKSSAECFYSDIIFSSTPYEK